MTVYAEWAVHGKHAGDAHDYRILGSSRDRAEDAHFEGLIRRAAPGTPQRGGTDEPGALPWVTFDVAGGAGEPYWSGIALKEWSTELDRSSRPVTTTRYFTFPFADAAGPAVTYRGLYDQVAPVPLPRPAAAAVPLDLPAFDADALAERMRADARGFGWYATAAALLLDGPVALTEAGALPLTERIDCLDAVVALLPYGMRAALRTSTWADNLADHGVRLFFGEWVGKPHQHRVRWDAHAEPAAGTVGHVYRSALLDDYARHGGPAPVIERLARARTPRELDDRALLDALDCLSSGARYRREALAALLPRTESLDDETLRRRWSDTRDHIVTTAGLELAAGRPGLARTYLPVAARGRQAGSFIDDVLALCPPSHETAAQAEFLSGAQPPKPGTSPELHATVLSRPEVAYTLLCRQVTDPRAPLEAWLAWLCPPGRPAYDTPGWLRAFGTLLPGRSTAVRPDWVGALVGRFGPDALVTLLRTAARTGEADVALFGCWDEIISIADAGPPPLRDLAGEVLGLLKPRDPWNRSVMDALAPLFGREPSWAARTPRADSELYLSGLLSVWLLPRLEGRRERMALALVTTLPHDHWLLNHLRRLSHPRVRQAVAEQRRGPRRSARWSRPRLGRRSKDPGPSGEEDRT
ncbi:hypothetical protein ACFYWX_03475 [Streptomyces sp. NPDC002888]|uniref:hypothetical protein n=1 Tax=Streptomyces sp. NPDC002888 TaxID=3364668 RepID=UPI0036BB795B